MKSLVIVESPTKAKTIGKFLGKDYEIIASMGHIMDLPKSTLGVDLEHDFLPDYKPMPDKNKIILQLKTAGKNADNIILATDPDREGEAIAAHIAQILTIEDRKLRTERKKIDFPISNSKNLSSTIHHLPSISRVVFHEITKEAIEEAFKHPREVDQNLVDAQTARRILDRLVGYKLSPILWQKVRRGLSAGRVQSVALRLIVEREKEIEKFKKEKYYTIHAFFSKEEKVTEFELIEIDSKKIEKQESFDLYANTYKISKTTIETGEDAEKILEKLNRRKFKVSDVIKKQAKRSSGPAFTTSTLQQDASRRFGFSGKRTMGLAQKLYEEGFITYHRTDSVAISTTAISAIRSFIEKEYGRNYIPESPKFYKAKQKLAQEAHEAIRPTKVEINHHQVTEELGRDYAKIYEIIWNRAVSSQMSDAIVESTSVMVDSQDGGEKASVYRFKANGSVLVFDGFLKVNPQGVDGNLLPDFKAGEILEAKTIEQKEHETTPPPRYNDASLIGILEEKGIGRPSTYATIISTIEQRQYIERVEARFSPTNVGIAVNDFLVANFSVIDDIPFTATMEDELDEVAGGTKKWVPVIREFYTPFEKILKEVKGVGRVKIEVEKTDEICPQDKGHLIIRIGRFGKFMACENFPACKFTKPLVEETGLLCPKCGGDSPSEALAKGGKIIFKKTKKGRRFYGCSNYPNCDFASWTKPTSEHVERSEIPNGNDHREKIEGIKKEQVVQNQTSKPKQQPENKLKDLNKAS